eukprot:177499-Chlamydomonas_euryale.AAC.1
MAHHERLYGGRAADAKAERRVCVGVFHRPSATGMDTAHKHNWGWGHRNRKPRRRLPSSDAGSVSMKR